MQVIAASIIGLSGASAFLKYSNTQYRNQAISIAEDELTFDQANKIFQEEDWTANSDKLRVHMYAIKAVWFNLVKGILWMFKLMRNKGAGYDLQTCMQGYEIQS